MLDIVITNEVLDSMGQASCIILLIAFVIIGISIWRFSKKHNQQGGVI